MYLGSLVLAVAFAVTTAAPLTETKLDRMIRLLTDLKEQKVHARGTGQGVTTSTQYVISSAYCLGETKLSALVSQYAPAMEPSWTIQLLTTRQGAPNGVIARGQPMEKAAFKQWLDQFKATGVISKEMREAAAVHLKGSKATMFAAVVVVRYKPANTKLAISM